MICIPTVTQTTWIGLSQWEAYTVDGRPVYIKYKYGELEVWIGPIGGSIDDALGTAPAYWDSVGEKMGSILDCEEVMAATGITMAEAV